MNKLIVLVAILVAGIVNSILTPSKQERIEQARIMAAVENLVVRAEFSAAELEWMDQLSQKFPQAANAFQKLYALEKMENQISKIEYQALHDKYRKRLIENKTQAKSLLKFVNEARLKGNDSHPIKVLAQRVQSTDAKQSAHQ